MFQKLQAKAQAALSGHRSSDADDHTSEHTQSTVHGQNDPTQPTQQSGGRHHAIDNITHTLKTLHTQYSPQVRPDARQLQLVITSQKGIALDFDAVSRDSKSHSKELYLWGQDQVEDVKDVSDRIAYLNFVHGSLASELGQSLDSARASYKSLRDAETALHPRRTNRSNMKAEIERIKAAGSSGKAPANGAERVAELQSQLAKAEADDDPQEREVALLKRRALVECERKKWAAFREYGAKLALLADASEALLTELPEQESHGAYGGASNTARIRSQLQHALDTYTPAPGQTNQFKNSPPVGSGIGAGADTRSFGETHKDELSSLPPTVHPTPQPGPTSGPGALAEQRFGSQSTTGAHPDSLPIASAQPGESVTRSSTTATAGHTSTPTTAPLNPASLNHAPAPIPGHSPSVSSPLRDATAPDQHAHAPTTDTTAANVTSPSAVAAPVPITSPAADSNHITVAETGVPLTAGADGPGPKSGSLSRDNVPPAANTATGLGVGSVPPAGTAPQTGTVPGTTEQLPGFAGATRHETAEEEKARLAREERERLLHGSTSGGGHLSAEEEKARLEREERERVLRGQQTQGQGEIGEDGKTVPPPYADF
ncbi:hypothetical protein FRC07_003341 [Ceratobasidium sp. 392]|nr:hypothetical protein FRC07_003341 [Ceratobasidium sp. 392]